MKQHVFDVMSVRVSHEEKKLSYLQLCFCFTNHRKKRKGWEQKATWLPMVWHVYVVCGAYPALQVSGENTHEYMCMQTRNADFMALAKKAEMRIL